MKKVLNLCFLFISIFYMINRRIIISLLNNRNYIYKMSKWQLTDEELKCAVNSVFEVYDKDKNGILDFD